MPEPHAPVPSPDVPAHEALPDGVRTAEVHGAPALLIDHRGAKAVIHLDGAHLTSWVPAGGRDLLWTSPTSRHGRGVAIRGGVPLVGTWFGSGRDGAAPYKHGWLRTSRWELDGTAVADGPSDPTSDAHSLEVALRLDGADPSGHGIHARVRFHLTADTLAVALEVTAGDTALDLESALHTYLAVSDAERTELTGFAGADYLDNTADLARFTQKGEPRISGEVDRVYDVAQPVRIADPGTGRTVDVLPQGSTRTVLWNPGAALARTMGDLPDDGWRSFVCVETAVCKDGFVHLEPGEAHTVGATFRVEA